jgi:integrase
MTIVWNPRTGNAEADIRHEGLGRLHVSLRTKKVGVANDRYAAVKALYFEGDPDLIAALRNRKLTLDSIVRVHREKKAFNTLLATTAWPTLREAVDQYLTWIRTQTDKAPGTYDVAKSHLEAAVRHFGEEKRLDAITHEDAEAWKLAILSRELRGKNDSGQTVKPWTAGMALIRLSTLYQWVRRQEERRAAREGRAPRRLDTPIDREIIPKRSTPRSRFLSVEEATHLLAATPESLKFPIMCGLLGGLRIGEVCTLRPPPQDINFDVAGGIILVQEKTLASGVQWRPKNKKRREVPIANELLPVALHHAKTFGSTAWLVPSIDDPDLPMKRNTLEVMFRRIVTDAGLIAGRDNPAGVTFHTLRHTFASWLVMAGVDLWTVAQLLGHSTIKMVQETYGHLSPNHKRLAVDRLGQSYQLRVEATEDPT